MLRSIAQTEEIDKPLFILNNSGDSDDRLEPANRYCTLHTMPSISYFLVTFLFVDAVFFVEDLRAAFLVVVVAVFFDDFFVIVFTGFFA